MDTKTPRKMAGPLEADFLAYRTTGDSAALERIIDRVRPELIRIATYYLRQRDAAEDVVHSTFLTAIERRDSFESGRRLVPWLTGILLNKISSHRRQGRRWVGNVNPDLLLEASPLREAELHEVRILVRDAVKRLPPRYREVLDLYLLQSQGGGEIARQLRRPVGTIRAQIHRGLVQLRMLLPGGLALGALLRLGRGRQAHAGSATTAGTGGLLQSWITVTALTGCMLVALLVMLPEDVVHGRSRFAMERAGLPAPEVSLEAREMRDRPRDTGNRAGTPPASFPEEMSVAGSGSVAALAFLAFDAGTRTPIADAELRIQMRYLNGAAETGKGKTNEKGRFELPCRPEQIEWVRLEAYDSTGRSMLAVWNREGTAFGSGEPLEVGLARERRIGGIVLDPEGAPIEGAHIQLHGYLLLNGKAFQPSPAEREATSDVYGRWSIPDAPNCQDRIRINVSHPGFVPTLLDTDKTSPPAEELWAGTARSNLERGRSVRLEIRDRAGMAVVPTAVRIMQHQDPPLYVVPIRVELDGTAEFTLPEEDRFYLQVKAADCAPWTKTIRRERVTDVIQVRLDPVHACRVTILDPDGEPVGRARVRAFGDAWTDALTADEEGRVTILGWNGRRLPVEIRRPGALGTFLHPVDGGTRVIRLREPRTLLVRVTDTETGHPLSGYEVRLLVPGKWHLGDRIADGGEEFELKYHPHVATSEVQLQVSMPGYQTAVTDVLVPGSEPLPIAVQLAPSSTIEIRILSADGSEANFASILIATLEAPGLLENGSFIDSTLPSRQFFTSGKRPVRITRPEGVFSVVIADRSGFRLVPGNELEASTTVQLAPMGCVEGTVADGSTVRLGIGNSTTPEMLYDYFLQPDPTGAFHFCHVPVGPITVYREDHPELGVHVRVRADNAAHVEL